MVALQAAGSAGSSLGEKAIAGILWPTHCVVNEKQMREIATQKMPDLNAASVESAIKSIKGTARSMGIDVVG